MNIHNKRLYELLAIAMQGRETITHELFTNLSDLDWQELLQLATTHGVKFIAYEGLDRLPAECRPQSRFHLNWYMSVVQAEHRRKHYIKVLDSLLKDLYGLGVERALILKGLTVSQYYPVPARRECGDIDLFLFENKELCDNIMRGRGIEVNTKSQKDSAFVIEGVYVENHSSLFDQDMAFEREATMYDRAQSIFYEMFRGDGLEEFELQDIKVSQLTPQCSALYQILHLFRHTTCLILALRQFCDFSVLFTKYRETIDIEELRAQLKELNLEFFVESVEEFCKQHFGYQPYIIASTSGSIEKGVEFFSEILSLFNSPKRYIIPGRKALVHKYKRYRSYKLFFPPTSLIESFIPEMFRYIKLKFRGIICSKT